MFSFTSVKSFSLPQFSILPLRIQPPDHLPYLELVLCRVEALEQQTRFSIAGVERTGVALDNGWVYRWPVVHRNTAEQVRDANELLHLTEISGFDFLECRLELKPAVSGNISTVSCETAKRT